MNDEGMKDPDKKVCGPGPFHHCLCLFPDTYDTLVLNPNVGDPEIQGRLTLLICDYLLLGALVESRWHRAGSEMVLGGGSHTPAVLLIIETQELRRPLGNSQTLASISNCIS